MYFPRLRISISWHSRPLWRIYPNGILSSTSLQTPRLLAVWEDLFGMALPIIFFFGIRTVAPGWIGFTGRLADRRPPIPGRGFGWWVDNGEQRHKPGRSYVPVWLSSLIRCYQGNARRPDFTACTMRRIELALHGHAVRSAAASAATSPMDDKESKHLKRCSGVVAAAEKQPYGSGSGRN